MNQLEIQLLLSAQNVLVTEAMFRMQGSDDYEFNQAISRYLATKERLVKSYAKKRPKAELEAEPSLDEVTDFMAELGRGDPDEDATWFMNKMAAQGWLNGGKQIKSWKHLLRNWNVQGFINPKRGDEMMGMNKKPNQPKEMRL